MFDSLNGQVLKHSEAHPGIKPCVPYWISIASWLKTSSCTLQFHLCQIHTCPLGIPFWPRAMALPSDHSQRGTICNDLSQCLQLKLGIQKDEDGCGLVLCAPNLYCRHCDRQFPTDSTISKVPVNEEGNTTSIYILVLS